MSALPAVLPLLLVASRVAERSADAWLEDQKLGLEDAPEWAYFTSVAASTAFWVLAVLQVIESANVLLGGAR